MTQSYTVTANFEPELIKIRILETKKELPRPAGILPFALSHQAIWRHLSGAKGTAGHVVTIVRDSKGIQVYACCVGSFSVIREEIADPFMLDIEDPKDLLAALCEYFWKIDSTRETPEIPRASKPF